MPLTPAEADIICWLSGTYVTRSTLSEKIKQPKKR